MSQAKSNALLVKEFTEESTGNLCPPTPRALNKDQVLFIIRMVMSELDELATTVSRDVNEKNDLMNTAFSTLDPCNSGFEGELTPMQVAACQGDAMVDAWYYMLNSAAKVGINLSRIFDQVHQANMDKRNPETGKFEKREDGKVIKPNGWKEPDIVSEINSQYQYGSWNI